MNAPDHHIPKGPRLTSLNHGGGSGCKIAKEVLTEILKNTNKLPIPPELLIGIDTADDAAVYQLSDDIALIATTAFFMPIAGGHTIDSVEAIDGLVALGVVHPKKIKRNSDAKVGDRLILGKPLGVGVLSAALKKEQLSDAGYRQMIAVTTKPNTPEPDLAAMDGVHALTDVTGFGLAGHALELARGAKAGVAIDWAKVPLLDGVRALVEQGMVTGASGRNWEGCGKDIDLPADFSPHDQVLLSDPRTSGGLLVSCDAASVDDVLAVFKQHGFGAAAEIGEIVQGDAARLRIH